MRKFAFALAFGMLGYCTTLSAQQSLETKPTRIDSPLDTLYVSETDRVRFHNKQTLDSIIPIIKDIGKKTEINHETLSGTRYVYIFEKNCKIDGIPYFRSEIGYVQLDNGSQRMYTALYDGDYDITLQIYYDGLDGTFDGLPEKFVAADYGWGDLWSIKRAAKKSQFGDLSYFGNDLKPITSENGKHMKILESFLLKHNNYFLKKSKKQ